MNLSKNSNITYVTLSEAKALFGRQYQKCQLSYEFSFARAQIPSTKEPYPHSNYRYIADSSDQYRNSVGSLEVEL